MKRICGCLLIVALALGSAQVHADDKKLRIISWADYVPADLIAAFKKETGYEVEVTLSNNEEMISKLRATGGAGYDLAQPSQDRIVSAQREFGIYKPIDLAQIKLDQFTPEIAPRSGELFLFQRTPPWLGPSPDYHEAVPEGQRWLYAHVPTYSEWNRFWMFWRMGDGSIPVLDTTPTAASTLSSS